MKWREERILRDRKVEHSRYKGRKRRRIRKSGDIKNGNRG